MFSFENFLLKNSLKFLWRSYALTGNIVNKKNIPVDDIKVKMILTKFFKECTLNLNLVKNAKNSLNILAQYYQILILSNIPFEFYEKRLKALRKNDFPFPFFANQGSKGKACSYLYEHSKHPVWFIDDSPYQIKSVKQETQDINTILFISNKKLEDLINNKSYGDFFSNTWEKNTKIILT